MRIGKNLKMLVVTFVALFTLTLSVKAIPTNDLQPDSVVKIEYASGGVQYNNDLQSAVNTYYADAGINKITLLDNVNIELLMRANAIPTEGCIIELDLAGHTITLTGSDPFMILGSDFTITDSSADKTGTIKATNVAIQVSSGHTLTLDGGNIISTSESAPSGAVEVYGPSELIMNGGNIEGNYGIAAGGNGAKVEINNGTITANVFAVSGNGGTTQNSDITINGGTLTSNTNAAIYQPQTGDLTITGGNITGKIGIVARQGNVTIKGNPTITANGTKGENIRVGDARTGGEDVLLPNGVAVIVDNATEGGYSDDAKVKIENGTFVANDKSVVTFEDEENASQDIIISGGDFGDDDIAEVYLAEDRKQSESGVVGEVYDIEVDKTENGEVKVNKNAAVGEIVKIEVIAAKGYKVGKITVTYSKNGKTENVEVKNNSFVMPEGNVKVNVQFVKITDTTTNENPATYDSILTYVGLAIASIGVLAIASKKVLKNN